MRVFTNRLGNFLILIGAASLVLFFASDFAREPNIGYLLWGIFLIVLGYIIRRASRPDPEESQRFRSYRKLKSRRKKKEDKENN
jgi:hypothetical protein